MNLEYLMTSDFNEGLKPEELIELLNKFRYEYRLLSGKNTSLTKELEKNSIVLENLKGLNFEIENKSNARIALLEDELHFLRQKLNRKLTLKERFKGEIKG
jgi:hypothetical protein